MNQNIEIPIHFFSNKKRFACLGFHLVGGAKENGETLKCSQASKQFYQFKDIHKLGNSVLVGPNVSCYTECLHSSATGPNCNNLKKVLTRFVVFATSPRELSNPILAAIYRLTSPGFCIGTIAFIS